MKFKVIKGVLKAGQTMEQDLEKQLNFFAANGKKKSIIFMTQSSLVLKTGTPITILTICFDEMEQGEPRIRSLG